MNKHVFRGLMLSLILTLLSSCGGNRTKDNSFVDIYATYYSVLSLDLLHGSSERSDLKKFISNVEANYDTYFFNEKKFDNLSNIYFYVQTLKFSGNNVKDPSRIVSYVSKLQTDQGNFGFSNKHKLSLEMGGNVSGSFLSTYMATFILTTLKADVPNITKLHNWIDNTITNAEFVNDSEFKNGAYIFLLLGTCDLLNIKEKDSYLAANKDNVNSLVKKITKVDDFSYFSLNTLLDLSSYYQITLDSPIIDSIYKKIVATQSNDGGFIMGAGDKDSNILPTYIALRFFKQYGLPVSNERKVQSYLNNTLNKALSNKL